MTTYYTLDVTNGTLVQASPSEFTSTSDLTEAIEGAKALTSLHERKFRHVTLEEYVAFTAELSLNLRNSRRSHEALIDVVRTHLEEGTEGSTDVDEFIKEHQELADAIGFEFLTETTLEITLEVVVKHRMGTTDIEDALDVQVKELYGYGDTGIVDIDVTDICIDER